MWPVALNLDHMLRVPCVQCRLVRSGSRCSWLSVEGGQSWENRGWTGKTGFVEAVRWGRLFSFRPLTPSWSDHVLLPEARCPGGSGQGR